VVNTPVVLTRAQSFVVTQRRVSLDPRRSRVRSLLMVLLVFFFCPCTTLEFFLFVQRIIVVVLLDLVGKGYALVVVTISFVPSTVLSFRLMFVFHHADSVLCSRWNAHSCLLSVFLRFLLLRSLDFSRSHLLYRLYRSFLDDSIVTSSSTRSLILCSFWYCCSASFAWPLLLYSCLVVSGRTRLRLA